MKIKIFIGTEPKTEIARKVLEYSIQSNTLADVETIPMLGDDWKIRPPTGVGTGFSLLRWDIPRRMNYKGFAIYLDADMLVLDDINELYRADIDFSNDRCSVWCTYQTSKWFKEPTPETSAMLIDCEKSRFNQKSLDEIFEHLAGDSNRKRYVQIMRALKHKNPPQKIPNIWNHLNKMNSETKIIHYTKEPEQPWYNPKHKFKDVWEKTLIDAIDDNFVTKAEIEEAIKTYRKHDSKRGFRGTGMHPYWKKVL